MYFIDEEKVKLVRECPSCGKGKFLPWQDCSPDCSGKQLEEEHKKVVKEMLKFALPDIEIKTIFLGDKSMPIMGDSEHDKWNWGETKPFANLLRIPWYTLRSKWQFFNVIVHEIAHFLAYREKYSPEERKVIERIYCSSDSPYPDETEEEILDENKENKEIVVKYLVEYKESKEGHWYDPWYLEYKKLFWKFYNDSNFQKYTYGKINEPLKFGFDEEGNGEYKVEIVKYN